MPVSECFHVRVLIPCYTEALEIVQPTLMAVANAALPKASPTLFRRAPQSGPWVLRARRNALAVASSRHWR